MRAPIDSFLPALPLRFLAGADLDLLDPLRLHEVGAPLPELAGTADRSGLAAALLERNRGWGHVAPHPLCERLADPAARLVVTGQQAGLLGGPLYTLTKALAAVRWAQHLGADGEPAVAVFWIATEDHDLAEVARCYLPRPSGPPLCCDLDDREPALLPVGEMAIGDTAQRLLRELQSETSHPGYRSGLVGLEECCRPEDTYGDAFARLLTRVLGDRCPLLLDAREPALKQLERPWLERLVERRTEIASALGAREAEIIRRGLALQVAAQPEWSPLFMVDDVGARRKIGWRAGGFELRGGEGGVRPLDELFAILATRPDRVSPGALARPAIQDAALGSSLFVVGPGELSYMAQAASIYPVLGVAPPRLALRPQIMLVDPRRRDQITELVAEDLDLETLLGTEDQLEEALARRAGGEPVSAASAQMQARFLELRAPLRSLDPQLDAAWQKTWDQIERSLASLRGRATKSAARADEVTRVRVTALRELCLPEGRLQERRVTLAHFSALYGDSLVETVWRELDLDPRFLQILAPADAGPEAAGPEAAVPEEEPGPQGPLVAGTVAGKNE